MLKINNSATLRSNSICIFGNTVSMVSAYIDSTKSIKAELKTSGKHWYYLETADSDTVNKTITAYININ